MDRKIENVYYDPKHVIHKNSMYLLLIKMSIGNNRTSCWRFVSAYCLKIPVLVNLKISSYAKIYMNLLYGDLEVPASLLWLILIIRKIHINTLFFYFRISSYTSESALNNVNTLCLLWMAVYFGLLWFNNSIECIIYIGTPYEIYFFGGIIPCNCFHDISTDLFTRSNLKKQTFK